MNEASEPQFLSIEPMEGLTQPEEVAAAVTFIMADESSWIIGITLPVDGGYLAGLRTWDGIITSDRPPTVAPVS